MTKPDGEQGQTAPTVNQLASSHDNVTILFTEWVCLHQLCQLLLCVRVCMRQ